MIDQHAAPIVAMSRRMLLANHLLFFVNAMMDQHAALIFAIDNENVVPTVKKNAVSSHWLADIWQVD